MRDNRSFLPDLLQPLFTDVFALHSGRDVYSKTFENRRKCKIETRRCTRRSSITSARSMYALANVHTPNEIDDTRFRSAFKRNYAGTSRVPRSVAAIPIAIQVRSWGYLPCWGTATDIRYYDIGTRILAYCSRR